MPHRTDRRSVGRHRRERVSRHRRSLSPFDRPAALLTASLSAALIAGVAGGTAAAAADRPTPVADVWVPARTPVAPLYDFAPAKAEPRTADSVPHTSADLSAAPQQQKARPKPVVHRAAPATAAWVNPNPAASVTSCFGQRWGRLHAGVDLAGPDGTPIVAAGAGVVTRAGVAEGYGNAVLIDHGNGYLTHYGHLSAITVQVGQHVDAGQQIGNEGSTGHSTGPHLHFEVHQGYYQNPVEPTSWMHDHGVEIAGCG